MENKITINVQTNNITSPNINYTNVNQSPSSPKKSIFKSNNNGSVLSIKNNTNKAEKEDMNAIGDLIKFLLNMGNYKIYIKVFHWKELIML